METAAATQDTGSTTGETAAATQSVAASQNTQPKSIQKELDSNLGMVREPEMTVLSRYQTRARNPPERLNL